MTRRWFRFSVRTMLVVVAAAALGCTWLSSRRSWANERNAFWKEAGTGAHGRVTGPVAEAPMLLEYFGSQTVQWIQMDWDATPEQIARTESLFPEAMVRVCSKRICCPDG